MDNWTIMAPHARLAFGATTTTFLEELAKVAGVKNKQGIWHVPANAVAVVNSMAEQHGAEVEAAAWAVPPTPRVTWEEIETQLRARGEVQPWVLDGFLTAYQKDALAFGWNLSGLNLWHPTGCLTGDTMLKINRAGKCTDIRLDDLVQRFSGSTSSRWDPAIDTNTQCAIDGFVRLNRIVDAFESGVKPVFVVKAHSADGVKYEIRATDEHPFLTSNGFVKLSDIRVGHKVKVRGDQKKDPSSRSKKTIYKQTNVRHHPHAVVVKQPRSDKWCRARRFRPGYVETSYRVPQHRMVVEAHLNGLTLSEWTAICRLPEAERQGEYIFLDPSAHAVHHIDGNANNNSLSNLKVMTHLEHATLHAEETMWQNVVYKVIDAEVISIEPAGLAMTYDVTMEDPHNNYVANGFVVHNSGKTLTGSISALSVDGPVVVVTRAASRIQYAREIERFIRTRAHVVRPESQTGGRVRVRGETWNDFRARHKGSGHSTKEMGKLWKAHVAQFGVDPAKTMKDYLHECYENNHRPFLVVGWESLPNYLAELCALKPGCIVLDESHRGKGVKRFDVVQLPELPQDKDEAAAMVRQQAKEAKTKDGFIKETPEGRKMFVPVLNIASAAATLARAAKKRVCTTATPVKDRVRDLWAQLDIAEPNAWGSMTAWMDRYAGRKPGTYGGFDTTGATNLEELNLRLKGLSHILAYEETHRELPKKRRQSSYISPEDQNAASAGFAAELRAAKARGPTAVLECQLAQAASKKRKAVLDMIGDHVGSKHKVVVFTGRKKDCEDLGADVRKEVGPEVTVWSAHGEQSVASRQAIIDEYMAHPGPCVLVGTGHAFGESLNIHDTDAALFVMLPYTPGQLRQWEGRFCVAAGQFVLTQQGAKVVESIQPGEYVLSHKGRWALVSSIGSRNLKTAEGGRRSVLTTLSVQGCYSDLVLTSDHKVLVSIDKREPQWIEAGRVAPSDELVVPRLEQREGTVVQIQFPSQHRVNGNAVKNGRYVSMPEWIDIDQEVAWLMGHFCGDGWTSSSTTHYVGIASNQGQVEGHLRRASRVFERWGISGTLRPASKGKGVNLYAYGKEIALWFRSMFGEDSHSKRIPGMVFSWPDTLKSSFLEGYWDADGSRRPDGEIQWTTVSPHLALGVFHLASGLGWTVTTHLTANGQYVGSYNPKSKMRVDDKYVYHPVRSTHSAFGHGEQKSEKVFDLEVQGDESFCVGGLAVHNCRLGQKRPVVIYYVIAEGTVDEHVADILISKLPAVEDVAKDSELADAEAVLAGYNLDQTDEEFAASVLNDLDMDWS